MLGAIIISDVSNLHRITRIIANNQLSAHHRLSDAPADNRHLPVKKYSVLSSSMHFSAPVKVLNKFAHSMSHLTTSISTRPFIVAGETSRDFSPSCLFAGRIKGINYLLLLLLFSSDQRALTKWYARAHAEIVQSFDINNCIIRAQQFPLGAVFRTEFHSFGIASVSQAATSNQQEKI